MSERTEAGGKGTRPGRGAVVAWLAPVFLSCWLLAAYFLQAEETLFTGLLLFLPLVMLLAPNGWVVWVFRVILTLGTALWVLLWWGIRQERLAQGAGVAAITAIILGIAAFTFFSTLVFEARTLRRHFRR